jgi:hypothetical protein
VLAVADWLEGAAAIGAAIGGIGAAIGAIAAWRAARSVVQRRPQREPVISIAKNAPAMPGPLGGAHAGVVGSAQGAAILSRRPRTRCHRAGHIRCAGRFVSP